MQEQDLELNTTEADVPPFVETEGSVADGAAELAEARAKADENYNKFLLAMADFENYKKRIERQFADIALAGRRSLLQKFLPVIDNLERALAVDSESDGLRDGVAQTLKGFGSLLAGEGVKAMEVKGQLFDPKLAEAIGTREDPAVADETVVEEAQKGYLLGDDVLRPAKVIVSKNS
ncbi:MAG: nucleotide exchange factor GrpE [Candidatus Meridianibacter frigidus]|nr:MAG: nucleotide exchange factor GrpE [Candidatus Eremiobacteraeota bacterium]